MDQHAHLWAASGCWCGARQCAGIIVDPAVTPGEKSFGFDSQLNMVAGRRCTNARAEGSGYCEQCRVGYVVCSNCLSRRCDGTRCL